MVIVRKQSKINCTSCSYFGIPFHHHGRWRLWERIVFEDDLAIFIIDSMLFRDLECIYFSLVGLHICLHQGAFQYHREHPMSHKQPCSTNQGENYSIFWCSSTIPCWDGWTLAVLNEDAINTHSSYTPLLQSPLLQHERHTQLVTHFTVVWSSLYVLPWLQSHHFLSLRKEGMTIHNFKLY